MSVILFGSSHRSGPKLGFRAWVSHWLAERRIRRDIYAVEGFDDALLHDIGVARAGIEDAVRHGRTRPL